jgi:hypothetical protein
MKQGLTMKRTTSLHQIVEKMNHVSLISSFHERNFWVNIKPDNTIKTIDQIQASICD